MQYNIHQKFITTPILDILRGAVTACKAIGYGIETQPLCEYIMQTTFLKMTGASEQKLKCIRWEMATYDYEYRYDTLLYQKLGECSQYRDKNDIFKEMQRTIKKIDTDNQLKGLFNEDTKKTIIEKVKNDISSIVENSLLSIWLHRDFSLFKSFSNGIEEQLFANNSPASSDVSYIFLEQKLKEYYEKVVYKHRNRCAHNLKSYQHNLPKFDTLASKEYEDEKNENYFKMFFILILMDELYMKLYNLYLDCLEKNLSI